MFGCLILASILTSFKAFSFSLSDSFTIFTFFKAYISLSASLFTWYTDEYAPSPIQNLSLNIHYSYFFFQYFIFFSFYFWFYYLSLFNIIYDLNWLKKIRVWMIESLLKWNTYLAFWWLRNHLATFIIFFINIIFN